MILGGGGTMFGGQGEQGTFAAHIKIGVAPAMKFTGTAQGLAWTAGVGVFAGVMNEQDRQVKLALEFPQKGEQRANLRSIIFVYAMQTNQGIQDEQDGLELFDGLGEALTVTGCVQSQRGYGDYFYGQRFEVDLSGASDTFQAPAHDVQLVFG